MLFRVGIIVFFPSTIDENAFTTSALLTLYINLARGSQATRVCWPRGSQCGYTAIFPGSGLAELPMSLHDDNHYGVATD